MTLFYVLVALLAINATLHEAIVARFGLKGNEPPLIFGIAYTVLAVLTFLQVSYVHLAVLIVTLVGTAALIMAFKSIKHDKTIEKVILVVNVAIILLALYLR